MKAWSIPAPPQTKTAVPKRKHGTSTFFISLLPSEPHGNKRKSDVDAVHDFVYSDRKWLGFIINQLIMNAAKYCRTDSSYITIRSKKDSEFVKLFVADNGIGIPEQDITRVFDKGFTGANGRLLGRSTGMGLYLCEKLCLKLGHCISISSTQGEGTEVTIKFPFRDDHK